VSERLARLRPLAALALASASVVAFAGSTGHDGLRDPLRPPGWGTHASAASFDASRWQLSSTLVSNGRRVAIVNGRTVRAGDHVDGARVLGIAAGRVRMDYQGHDFTIRRAATRVRVGEHRGDD